MCMCCGYPAPLTIRLAPPGAAPLTLVTCTKCEHRVWTGPGGAVQRTDLLRSLAGNPRFDLVEQGRGARGRRRAAA